VIIGLAGAKQSGKTLLANLLADRYGLQHFSFAAPIREFVASLLGGTLDQLEVEKEVPIAWLNGVTPRHMMQTLGTEWGRRMIDQDIWLRLCMRKAVASGRCVVSDVRFPNEAKAIRELGGSVIRLNRWSQRPEDRHISERPLEPELIDFELANDTDSPQALLRAVEVLLPELRDVGQLSTSGEIVDPGSPAELVDSLLPTGSKPGEE
jgi:hypothetical protein